MGKRLRGKKTISPAPGLEPGAPLKGVPKRCVADYTKPAFVKGIGVDDSEELIKRVKSPFTSGNLGQRDDIERGNDMREYDIVSEKYKLYCSSILSMLCPVQ